MEIRIRAAIGLMLSLALIGVVGSVLLSVLSNGRVNANPLVVSLALMVAGFLLSGPGDKPSTERAAVRTRSEVDQQKSAVLLNQKLGRDRDEFIDLHRRGEISDEQLNARLSHLLDGQKRGAGGPTGGAK